MNQFKLGQCQCNTCVLWQVLGGSYGA